jgi:hypothetical protein
MGKCVFGCQVVDSLHRGLEEIHSISENGKRKAYFTITGIRFHPFG